MSFIILNGADISRQIGPATTKIEAATEVVKSIPRFIETVFSHMRRQPQYRYLTRPVYKACVGTIGPVAATAASFLASDLIIHQLLPQTMTCITSVFSEEATCAIGWEPWKTAYWMAVALPVMYAKYQRGS